MPASKVRMEEGIRIAAASCAQPYGRFQSPVLLLLMFAAIAWDLVRDRTPYATAIDANVCVAVAIVSFIATAVPATG
jgi:hypothetical protein